MKKKTILVTCSLIALFCFINSYVQKKDKPKISFSFDDGSIRDFPNHKNSDWNQQLLKNLKKNELKAILYVKGSGLDNKKGEAIIKSWNESGHLIGNHTYSHPNYNKTSFKQFKREFLKNDSLINTYSNYTKLFRFPYLKEGNTIQKRDDFRAFLKTEKYKIGHVTIDASDWYVDSRLTKKLKENPTADISGFKQYYIQHLFERAQYYDSLSVDLTGRQINHNLLLHHNLSASLFLDDLIQHFKNQGWEVVDVDKAYRDEFYKQVPQTIPAGESLVWALAKLSGKYEFILRYPAESGQYEKEKMDNLGL